MGNIFKFIQKYSNFLFFIILQGLSLFMLFKYNKYHNSVFMVFANEVSGKINEQYNKVEYYFYLKKTNDSLMKANERLYNMLREDFDIPDSSSKIVIDTMRKDSLLEFRKFEYREAKVVSNSVKLPNNVIVISRGSKYGIKRDLGVIDLNGRVVGTVIDLSDNYSVIMSILNKQSTISAIHQKSDEDGFITWDGKDHHYVTLKDISKSAKVNKGDSIVTSGHTPRFPKGLLIGTVEEVQQQQATNNYVLKIKTAANFSNIQYVFVIENLQKAEIDALLKRAEKINE